MTERPRHRGFVQTLKWVGKNGVAGVSLASLIAAAGIAWRSASDSGAKDNEMRQLRRDVDRLRDEHEWLVKTLFRLPAIAPPGPGGVP